MRFFVRRLEDELDRAAAAVGGFVGCSGEDLAFFPNATHAMNAIASYVQLVADDEVLLSNHEYGAVRRVWWRRCSQSRARTTLAPLPCDWSDDAEVVEALFQSVTERTRVIVLSHVSSQTSIIFPVAEVCRRARERGILTAIDGPHALAMLPINL